MAAVLKGIDVVNSIKEKLIKEVEFLKEADIEPCLGIVRIGAGEDDLSYERGAVKRCAGIGIKTEVYAFPEDIPEEKFLTEFQKINENDLIHGILLFRPFPKQIDDAKVMNVMNLQKDVDCMKNENLTKVFLDDETGYAPCTAEAVIRIIDHFGYDLSGKNVVVVGRSLVVGKPLSMMLLKKNATVTIGHSRTKNIENVCKNADILIAAVGKAKMIKSDFVNKDTVVVDVGINVDDDSNLCGDVDFSQVENTVKAITPVPGGVGTVTTSILAEHVVRAAREVYENTKHFKKR